MMRRSRVGGGHHPQSEGGASKGHRNLKSIHDGMVETVVESIVGGAAHGAGAVARAFGHKLPHWTHHGSVGYERDHELELDIESRVAPMRMADVLQRTQQKKEKEQEDYTSSMAPPPADKPSKSVSFAEAGAPEAAESAPAPSSSSALSKKTKPDCLKFIGRNVLKPTKEQEGSVGGMVKAVTAALDGQPVPYIIHFHKGGLTHTRRSLRDVVRRWQEQMDENRKTSSTHGGGSAAGGGGGGGGVSRRNSTSAHSTLQRSSWLFGSSNNLQVPADFGGSMREMSELSGAPGIHQQKSDGSRPTTLTLWVGTWNAGEKRLDADQVSDEALREWLRIPKPGWVLQGDQEEPESPRSEAEEAGSPDQSERATAGGGLSDRTSGADSPEQTERAIQRRSSADRLATANAQASTTTGMLPGGLRRVVGAAAAASSESSSSAAAQAEHLLLAQAEVHTRQEKRALDEERSYQMRDVYVIAFQELDVNYSHHHGASMAERLQRVLGDEYDPFEMADDGLASSTVQGGVHGEEDEERLSGAGRGNVGGGRRSCAKHAGHGMGAGPFISKRNMRLFAFLKRRDDGEPLWTNPSVGKVGTGGKGGLFTGLKGGVSLSMDIGGTRFCFVGAHLASDQHHLDKRNRNAAEILADGLPHGTGRSNQNRRRIKRLRMRLLFLSVTLSLIFLFVGVLTAAAGTRNTASAFFILAAALFATTLVLFASFRLYKHHSSHGEHDSHTDPTTAFDYIFFAGDLNYRLGKPLSVEQQHRQECMPHDADSTNESRRFVRRIVGMLDNDDPAEISKFAVENDQLQSQINNGAAFAGFDAGTELLTFAPTYKTIKYKDHADKDGERSDSVTSYVSAMGGERFAAGPSAAIALIQRATGFDDRRTTSSSVNDEEEEEVIREITPSKVREVVRGSQGGSWKLSDHPQREQAAPRIMVAQADVTLCLPPLHRAKRILRGHCALLMSGFQC